jgi:alcohol dehydrogenase, propanol-preferring
MLLEAQGRPLVAADVPKPAPGPGQALVRVRACGLCRTDLHVVDGDLAEPKLPLILGHQVVGAVESVGDGVDAVAVGDRVGIPWLGWTCGACRYCLAGRENLCDRARFTGYDLDGGFAAWTVADARYCFPIPDGYADLQAAPLLCAGLIGFRAYRMTGDAERLGLYGFGAAAHILTQVAVHQGRTVYAVTRPGDTQAQQFALELGAAWAGASTDPLPVELDAAIIFAPAGELLPLALQSVAKGGVVVCGGIHMTTIPSFAYQILWGERTVRSVANLTRQDGAEFLRLAPAVPVVTHVQTFALEAANDALASLRAGTVRGQNVIVVDDQPA